MTSLRLTVAAVLVLAAAVRAGPAPPMRPAPSPPPSPPSADVPTATLSSGPTPAPPPGSRPGEDPVTPVQGPLPVLVGAGDMASCRSDRDEATAELLDRIPGTVFTLGDNVYEEGTEREWRECYHPSWGRHRHRTRPSIGNHDTRTDRGRPYYAYFGSAAGPPGLGYYDYTLAGWHIVVINSDMCINVGCPAGSAQVQWLRRVTAETPATCRLAYMHHPLMGSGDQGNYPRMKPIWEALYEAGTDLVLAGHDHNYERFFPQDPDGRPDPVRGIRQIIVGTGGRSHLPLKSVQPNSEVRHVGTFGVLVVRLQPDSYEWEFVPVRGKTFRDFGSDRCH